MAKWIKGDIPRNEILEYKFCVFQILKENANCMLSPLNEHDQPYEHMAGVKWKPNLAPSLRQHWLKDSRPVLLPGTLGLCKRMSILLSSGLGGWTKGLGCYTSCNAWGSLTQLKMDLCPIQFTNVLMGSHVGECYSEPKA